VFDERRAYQRLYLPKPVAGRFGEHAVQLIEVSATGTHVRTGDELAVGAHAPLRFHWRDEDIAVSSEIVWFEDGRAGLRFTDYPDVLRRVLGEAVRDLLRETGVPIDREPNVIDEAEEFPAAEVFVTWSLSDGVWKRRSSLLPEQPVDGFTISASEDPEHIDLLCRTYETGDAETRRLTRMFAELSVSR